MLADDIVVVRSKHGLLVVNKNDEYVGRSILTSGEWCENEITALAQALRSGDTVIEVGANIGAHTIALSAMVGAAGTIHAFEPQRIIFHHLAAAVAINGLTNVHCHHAGVGRAMGKAIVPPVDYGRPGNFGGVSLCPDRDSPVTVTELPGESVDVVTIDSLNLPACRLLKIDAEGMEREVLEGARDTLTRLRPAIYTEWEYLRDGPETAIMLIGMGYHVFPHCSPGNYNLYAFPCEWGVGLNAPELILSGGTLMGLVRQPPGEGKGA